MGNLITWHGPGDRRYETGVRNAVLYPQDTTTGTYPEGFAWNGISSVAESPSGGEATPIYADDIKYLNLMSVEEFGATITAFMYPDEFMECDGSKEISPGVYAGQQTRKPFGLSYRTTVGNELELNDYGYKLHLFWNGLASPSDKEYTTINDTPEANEFSWEVSTTPAELPANFKPTASIVIDSTKVDKEKLAAFEKIIYGTKGVSGDGSDDVKARLPLPMEVVELLGVAAVG